MPTNSEREQIASVLIRLHNSWPPDARNVFSTNMALCIADYLIARQSQTVQAVLDAVQEVVNSCRELGITDLELYEHQSGGEELPAINRHVLNIKLAQLRQRWIGAAERLTEMK